MSSGGAPCGACKFLRRKCVKECIFAPYFGSEQGAARFAAVHKIFGASNVSKLLQLIPVTKRCDAVLTITYEAQARISDPVYGCVAQIFTLQQQVASLQAELAIVQAQLASQKQLAGMQSLRHQPVTNLTAPLGFPTRSEPNSLLFEASLLTTDPIGTSSSLSFPTNISLNNGGGSGYEVKKESEGVGGLDFLEVVGCNSDTRGSSPPHHHLSFMSYQQQQHQQQEHHHHH